MERKDANEEKIENAKGALERKMEKTVKIAISTY